MVPAAVTLSVLDEQFQPAAAWGSANGWELTLNRQELVIDGRGAHPVDRRPLRVLAGVDSYPSLPPSWRFVDPETGQPTAPTTPNRGSRNGMSSIIYGVGVICAHFSRTAYGNGGPSPGPHNEWQLTAWADIAGGVQAHTLAEMICVINEHLQWSTGWLG
jgi:hypothetical protein